MLANAIRLATIQSLAQTGVTALHKHLSFALICNLKPSTCGNLTQGRVPPKPRLGDCPLVVALLQPQTLALAG